MRCLHPESPSVFLLSFLLSGQTQLKSWGLNQHDNEREASDQFRVNISLTLSLSHTYTPTHTHTHTHKHTQSPQTDSDLFRSLLLPGSFFDDPKFTVPAQTTWAL